MPVCKVCGYTASGSATACRMCGKPLEVVLAEAPDLKEPEQQHSDGSYLPPRLLTGRHRRLALFVVPSVAASLAAVCLLGIFFVYRTIPRLEQLVPRDAVGAAAVDGPWWWAASADIRLQPDVKKVIGEAERKVGLSLEQDVAPWIGQIGLSVLRADSEKPQILVCAQVRDWPAFFRACARLKAKATEAAGGAQWTTKSYSGVNIERLQATGSASEPVLELCWIKGWVLAGIGEGAVERSIDAYQGRTESLGQDPAWASALSIRPEHWFFWGAADFMKLVDPLIMHGMTASFLHGVPPPPEDAATRATLDKMRAMDFVGLAVLSDSGDGLRFDSVTVPRTTKGRTLWRDLHGTSGGIDGDILKRLPRGAMIALLAHDPNGWWHRYKSAALKEMPAGAERSFGPILQQLAPLDPILANFRGDCDVALTYETRGGFGVIGMAQAPDSGKASDSARALAGYLGQNSIRVQPDGGLYVLSDLASASGRVDDGTDLVSRSALTPGFGASGRELLVSSSKTLMETTGDRGESSLVLPEAARNADAAMVGDFRLLPQIVKDANSTEVAALISPLELENAHWYVYTVSAPDGARQQTTGEILSWDWRKALKAVMQLQQDQKTNVF